MTVWVCGAGGYVGSNLRKLYPECVPVPRGEFPAPQEYDAVINLSCYGHRPGDDDIDTMVKVNTMYPINPLMSLPKNVVMIQGCSSSERDDPDSKPAAPTVADTPAAVQPVASQPDKAPSPVEVQAVPDKPAVTVAQVSAPHAAPAPKVVIIEIPSPSAGEQGVSATVFRTPAKAAEFAAAQPAPVATLEPQKPAAPVAAGFDIRQYIAPILGVIALVSLIIWGNRRGRATGSYGSDKPAA